MSSPPPERPSTATSSPSASPAPRKLGNLAARFLTAALLVPGILALISWDNPVGVWGLVFAATLVSLHEFFTITLDDRVERWVGIAVGAAAAALLYWRPSEGLLVVPMAAVMVPSLFVLFRFRELPSVVLRVATMTFGVFYAGVLVTFLALLKKLFGPNGGDWILVVLMIAWFGDTGAYFAGRFLGRHKLYPAISPGKTWAGAFGGLAGSLTGIALANLWYFPELGWGHGLVVGVVGSALGQMGDLVESMFKRARGVKDSGKLLPGHGGMLDRIDAVLFIAPWVFLYATLFWRP